MGFLDKLFGKKQEVEVKKEVLELKFDEIPDFLDKVYSESFSEIEKNVFSNLAEIKHLIKALEESLSNLEKQKVEQDTGHQRLRKIVVTSKKTLIERMRNMTVKLAPIQSNDFIELSSYCSNSVNLLETEVNSFGKNIAYTGIVLKEPIKDLGQKLKELNSVFIETKKLFDSKKGLLDISSAKKSFEEIKQKNQLKQENSLKEKELLNQIDDSEEEIQELKKKLTELENSTEAKQHENLLQQKSGLMEKKQQTKTKLAELFYPVEKLLRSFRKLVEAKHFILTQEEKNLLNSYLSNPFLALKKDNNAETLKKIFNYIKELIKEGKISLKEKEKEKKINALNSLIEFDFFGNFFWELNETDKNLAEIEARINSLNISSKISSLKNNFSSLEHLKENYSAELQKQKSKSQELSQEIISLKNSLEKGLSEFSAKEITIQLKH